MLELVSSESSLDDGLRGVVRDRLRTALTTS
jgi:hypothetical protein